MSKTKHIALLGSTGSIGRQTLEVVRAAPKGVYRITVLSAGSNTELLAAQAKEFLPDVAVISDPSQLDELKQKLTGFPVKCFAGPEALEDYAGYDKTNIVVTALVGFAGLRPTLKAIRQKKHIALANKETLVVAGELVMAEAAASGVNILPVDSEHSAIFQCLIGESHASIEKIILTASGGPFRGYGKEALAEVTIEQALRHPNWSMGSKITIDSASLMNKGLEVIEAARLFGLQASQIEVLVHPQSILHSMVQFCDGSMKAQMGLPDMRLPIQFALNYPERSPNSFPRMDFEKFSHLTFERPDMNTFRNLQLAYDALEQGGNMPCILNAANEVAVGMFLNGEISFLQITEYISAAMEQVPSVSHPDLNELLETDKQTRQLLKTQIFTS